MGLCIRGKRHVLSLVEISMNTNARFSARQGYTVPEAEITIRHEAPDWLRSLVVQIAYESGVSASELRSMLCELLFEAPDPDNWSEPNVNREVHWLLRKAQWFQIYDFIELIATALQNPTASALAANPDPMEYFIAKMNEAFRRKGVGWQLVNGQIQIRGPESFEAAVRESTDQLEASGRKVASQEMHQALADLSRRPQPDVTGAIQHSMAALECVIRDVAGDPKATLGELLKKHPDLLPAPLDNALSKIWGFASEQGRHLRENQAPDIKEAELVVGLSGVLTSYLMKKWAQSPP